VTATIDDIITQRGISEIVHFTTHFGLLGCLATGQALARTRLREEDLLKHILVLNSRYRTEEVDGFDKSQNWLDYVNLSISEINSRFFKHARRWHQSQDINWFVMSFKADLLSDNGVFFSTTNNIYDGVKRAECVTGFQALFETSVHRKDNWYAKRHGRTKNLTTCEQAEVLYPDGLSMGYLQRVYAENDEAADAAAMYLDNYDRSDVEVVVCAKKFCGQAN
jgi:hypothetical protein